MADEFYKIDGNKVWLSPTAREYAAEYFGPGRQGLRKMAEYLRMVGADESEASVEGPNAPEAPSTAVAESGFLPHVTPSENIDDRRADPEYVSDATMKQLWGAMPHNVAPQVRTFGPNPLTNALGFGDIGRRPAPVPNVMGPFQPQYPAAFGNYGSPQNPLLPFE